jgi:hypothetical protein
MAANAGQAGDLPIPAEWCEIERLADEDQLPHSTALADYDPQTPPPQIELTVESAPQSARAYEQAIKPVTSNTSSMHEF